MKKIKLFEEFFSEAMYVGPEGLGEDLPEELPQYLKDAYNDLAKKEKDLTWWVGDTIDRGVKKKVFVIEYNLSATQKGQLIVYNIDTKKFDNVFANSTDSDLERASWEINYGTNKNRLEFFKKLRAGLSAQAPVTEAKLNEYTDDSFSIESKEASPEVLKLLSSIMPKTSKTIKSATSAIKQWVGKRMFVHVQYFEVKTKGTESPIYRLHQRQYWLRDEEVNTTLLTVIDCTDKNKERTIGSAYVNTDVLLKEYKEVFDVIKYAS